MVRGCTVKCLLASRRHHCAVALMHHLRRQQTNATVLMLSVVPLDKTCYPFGRRCLTRKTIRESRAVLQGFELCFRVWGFLHIPPKRYITRFRSSAIPPFTFRPFSLFLPVEQR